MENEPKPMFKIGEKVTTLETYKKQREEELEKIPEQDLVTQPKGVKWGCDANCIADKERINNFNNESIDGAFALIEKKIEGIKKGIVSREDCSKMDLSGMCDVRCDINYNQALRDLLSYLKDNQ